MDKLFSDKAWQDYMRWHEEDKRILKKINEMLRDIDRNGNDGIGKPEALKHQLSGYWSRKISDKDRLVYKIAEGSIYIMACKGHYEDQFRK
jgi:toxin YoeB